MTLDLRLAPLADVRALDLAAPHRDPWAGEGAADVRRHLVRAAAGSPAA